MLNLPPLQLWSVLNNGRYMNSFSTFVLLALGLGLQFVFLGFLFFDTHSHLREQYRAAVFSCGAGLLGACIIAGLAIVRHDIVLLVGEVLALLTSAALLYSMLNRES